jgi:hypothetical protein
MAHGKQDNEIGQKRCLGWGKNVPETNYEPYH